MICEKCIKILKNRYHFGDALKSFNIYWKKRQYKHPKESEKDRKKALIFFKAGWSSGTWKKSKEEK